MDPRQEIVNEPLVYRWLQNDEGYWFCMAGLELTLCVHVMSHFVSWNGPMFGISMSMFGSIVLLYVKRIEIVIMFSRWIFGDEMQTDVAKSSSGCSVTDAVFALCWYLTVVSGTVCTHEQIILFTCHVLRSSECITSRNESPGRGHSEISFVIISWNHMPTPQTAALYRLILLLIPLLVFVSFLFLLSLLVPVVADIVHVFTYEVIAPDLYDRPLTLRVLVHQHQTENTQGHVWAQPNLAFCHSVAATSNQNAQQQITFISAPLNCIGWEVEWDNTSKKNSL